MKTKIVQALGIAVVLVLVLTTVAAAEHGSGTGTLTAKGDGLAAMRGDLSVKLSGSGLLLIRDLGGDATIEVKGKGFKKAMPNGTIAYVGFDGKAEVSGSAISVWIRGRNIKLEATGTGKFVLRGKGTYHTDHEDGKWSSEDKVISIE